MDCKVVLVQNNPALGHVRSNLEQHVASVEAAIRAGADLVVFPELSLTGYFLKDQTYELGLEPDAPLLAPLLELSKKISISFGMVERSREQRLYNAHVFLEQGRVLSVHRKVHLVTYGMFDESRDFAAGDRFQFVESRLGRFGFLVCEDMWHLGGTYLHFMNDVDALIVASASPGRGADASGESLASVRIWQTLLGAVSLFTQTFVLYANRVGWEDGISFSGQTCAFDPFGRRIGMLEGFDPGELAVHMRSSELQRARVTTPLRRDEKPWVLLGQLEQISGLRAKPSAERA
ncbi:MAG: carbon-nitrogen hydrolase [Planctomycetota bacterium]|nr:MAG: carbon-nitrogen hydrolase [Planctomycetota bacterium]